MRTVSLAGRGLLARKVLDWFHTSRQWRIQELLAGDEPLWMPSVRAFALGLDIPVLTAPDHLSGGDLLLSVQYDRILPERLLKRYKRAWNLHFSPLPKYRGVRPINWALKNGETTHGVTLHEMTPNADDGPIVAQTEFRIDPNVDEVIDVYHRCNDYGWLMFLDAMHFYDAIVPHAQDEAAATLYTTKDIPLLGERADWRRP